MAEDVKKHRKRVLTPAKEEEAYIIFSDEYMSYYTIKSKTGGRVPDVLNGKYTVPEYAKRAITNYLLQLRKGK